MITQSLLLGLTFAKEFFSRDTHILRAPVTSLIYRDGALAWGAVFGAFFCSRIRAQTQPYSIVSGSCCDFDEWRTWPFLGNHTLHIPVRWTFVSGHPRLTPPFRIYTSILSVSVCCIPHQRHCPSSAHIISF